MRSIDPEAATRTAIVNIGKLCQFLSTLIPTTNAEKKTVKNWYHDVYFDTSLIEQKYPNSAYTGANTGSSEGMSIIPVQAKINPAVVKTCILFMVHQI